MRDGELLAEDLGHVVVLHGREGLLVVLDALAGEVVQVVDDLEEVPVHQHQFLQSDHLVTQLLVLVRELLLEQRQHPVHLRPAQLLRGHLVLVLELLARHEQDAREDEDVNEHRDQDDHRAQEHGGQHVVHILVPVVLALVGLSDVDCVEHRLQVEERQHGDHQEAGYDQIEKDHHCVLQLQGEVADTRVAQCYDWEHEGQHQNVDWEEGHSDTTDVLVVLLRVLKPDNVEAAVGVEVAHDRRLLVDEHGHEQ
mmetsp:Transcript_12390/g.19304  ORF Transcript_12390/g.19304 Transcript_12390/m.19304 type:complete len:253 (-) Transcript_12390:4824-5582(-)